MILITSSYNAILFLQGFLFPSSNISSHQFKQDNKAVAWTFKFSISAIFNCPCVVVNLTKSSKIIGPAFFVYILKEI